jgi:hypothetical protein
MIRPLSVAKNLLVPKGRRVRTLRTGLLRGSRFHVDLTSDAQLFFGLAERELVRSFVSCSAGIRSAVDVGAAQGYYTLFFLEKTSAHHVFAFEPADESRTKLLLNLRENGLDRSERLHLSSSFVDCFDDIHHCSLDSLLSVLTFPCLVKIDIEGGECRALAGAVRLLGQEDVRWIIEVHSEELERECLHLMRANEYRTERVARAFIRWIVPEQRPGGHTAWIVARRDRHAETAAV